MVVARLATHINRWVIVAVALCAVPLVFAVSANEHAVLTGVTGALYALLSVAVVAGFFWSAAVPPIVAVSRLWER